ncbi:hypothetical protein K2X33_11475, partial [bacterium]|nr:hypothetical protein [bacterium]
MIWNNPRYRQTAILTAIAFLAVLPLLSRGTNIVTETYSRAAEAFWSGRNPYAAPGGRGDWYKYSPL